MEIIAKLQEWLAKQLDKLKVSNPVVFLLTQGVLVLLYGLIDDRTILIPTPDIIAKMIGIFGFQDLNSLISVVILGTMALVGSRTTSFLNK